MTGRSSGISLDATSCAKNAKRHLGLIKSSEILMESLTDIRGVDIGVETILRPMCHVEEPLVELNTGGRDFLGLPHVFPRTNWDWALKQN